MVVAPPPLPTQFPCWCRAIHSWGGEDSRDLGFIEGDLIECINAGDGSWWTGRLRRDKRTVGVFPSNFVEVLPLDYRPVSRSTSPLPQQANPSPNNTVRKSKPFRKPFEAYANAPHYTTAKQPEVYLDNAGPRSNPVPIPRSRENSATSLLSASERPRTPASRSVSPAPSFQPYRPYEKPQAPPPPPQMLPQLPPQFPPPSQLPPHQLPPQLPPQVPRHYPLERHYDSPPPPPPPPHRHVARQNSVNSFQEPRDYFALSRHNSNTSFKMAPLSRHGSQLSYTSYTSYTPNPPLAAENYMQPRIASPCPPSPAGSHMTPSPLREAMDGVIEQLDALGMPEDTSSPEPSSDPWSPESFGMANHRARQHDNQPASPPALNRSHTSMAALHTDEGYETWSGNSSQDPSSHYNNRYSSSPQKLSSYVERMETRLRRMHDRDRSPAPPQALAPAPAHGPMPLPPPPPPKSFFDRPKSSMSLAIDDGLDNEPPPPAVPDKKLRHRKSAYEVGRSVINRTFTTKTNTTNATNSTNSSSTTQSSGRSLMSGESAGAYSATSAGSYARRIERAQSALGLHDADPDRPETPFTGITYHSSHASGPAGLAVSQSPLRPKSQAGWHEEAEPGLGGLVQPKAPKRNIFKKILDSAKTGVASGRSNIVLSSIDQGRPSPFVRSMTDGASLMSSPGMGSGAGPGPGPGPGLGPFSSPRGRDAGARDMGLGGGGGIDWVQVRRDVNRSNSLSKIERTERLERCQMLDYPAFNPVDELYEGLGGDEGVNGMPVTQPANYQEIQYGQVDKNSRFVNNLPTTITAVTLATTYVCRPYRSDVQRLRAIFTWVAEKLCWEDSYETGDGGAEVDTRRVVQSRRACAEEYAAVVSDMCRAVGIHCEAVRGYLKTPGEVPESGGMVPRPNHWWNAVVIDGEWRALDCCLASPSNPRRALYSSVNGSMADFWWFLARPSEMCWTHVPQHHDQQHMCPPVAAEVLLHLPCACPPFFRHGLEMVDYSTSLVRIEDLEMVHVKVNVADDVEVAAEVEVRTYSRDSDGDLFESGDTMRKRALAQAEWFNGVKRYTIKALLPGDEGQGVLKLYAGKRGLMHSIKDIPHALALALPIIHTGDNPAYDFVTRHPTPHAQRHDIYVVQPQCQRLALNNTFVFAVRQHPSSPGNADGAGGGGGPDNSRAASPLPFARPSSAMSMTASSASGSNPSTSSSSSSGGYGTGGRKPAKLAIQTPGGKILRLMRKEDRRGGAGGSRIQLGPDDESGDGSTWETIIKCSEKGTWRGLVLADRTARWCVFAEWVCE